MNTIRKKIWSQIGSSAKYKARLFLKTITCAFFLCLLSNCSPEHFQKLSNQAATAQSGNADNGEAIDDGTVRFQQVVDKVMTPVCWDCHKKGLGTYEKVLAKVIPGEPDKSVFYLRAKTDMPPLEDGYPPLTDEQLEVIYQWIADGAQP